MWIPNRGHVLVRVLPEDVWNTEIGMVMTHGKEVSPNCEVVRVGAADISGPAVVEIGNRVLVPVSAGETFEEGGERYACVHHMKIRLIWLDD